MPWPNDSGSARGRRVALCVAEAAVLWNVSVVWGHPEDAVAVGLALYALLFALDGRWTGAGWLFGAAMATQPLILLMFPVLLALASRREIVGFVARSILPAVALLVTPLISQFHATTHALLDQPNYPGVDHATPWTALAPVISGKGTRSHRCRRPWTTWSPSLWPAVVGWRARRWRHDPDLIVWAAAVALALRCLTESVMVDFYVWPTLAVGLVVAWHGRPLASGPRDLRRHLHHRRRPITPVMAPVVDHRVRRHRGHADGGIPNAATGNSRDWARTGRRDAVGREPPPILVGALR